MTSNLPTFHLPPSTPPTQLKTRSKKNGIQKKMFVPALPFPPPKTTHNTDIAVCNVLRIL